jgi:choline kinase
MPRSRRDISIVIPAAGEGRRIRSFGPKPLLDIGHGQTVLNRQIRILQDVFPSADITLVVGYEADKVMGKLPRAIKVVENERFAETAVLRSIAAGLRVATRDHVLVVYGDLVFNREAVSTMTTGKSSILVSTDGQIRPSEVGVLVQGGKALNFCYGHATKWAQVVYLMGHELELFRKFALLRRNERCLGHEALNYVIDKGGSFRVVEPDDMQIVEIDSVKDIRRATEVVI